MAHGSPLPQHEVTEALDARRPRADPGRLGVYSLLGASAASIPVPWVPEWLLRRVRGGLCHDIATRRGIALSVDARNVLSDPFGPGSTHGALAQALRFVGAKLAVRMLASVGPAGIYWPLVGALRTFVLGHLFERYLEKGRSQRALRLDAEEAMRLRRAIDSALLHVLTTEAAREPEPLLTDDPRDAATAFVDAVLSVAAGLPGRALRQLDAAFDHALAVDHE